MTLITLDQIDLLEDTWARGVPHDQFAVLRREAPVYWHEHPNARGFWAITKHADVKAVSHDAATFSTEVGSAFILDQDPSALEFHRMTLLQMDPPKHNRYRRLVSAGFTIRSRRAPARSWSRSTVATRSSSRWTSPPSCLCRRSAR
jgi:cholest-4-en-3-one 26-monooxygenase